MAWTLLRQGLPFWFAFLLGSWVFYGSSARWSSVLVRPESLVNLFGFFIVYGMTLGFQISQTEDGRGCAVVVAMLGSNRIFIGPRRLHPFQCDPPAFSGDPGLCHATRDHLRIDPRRFICSRGRSPSFGISRYLSNRWAPNGSASRSLTDGSPPRIRPSTACSKTWVAPMISRVR